MELQSDELTTYDENLLLLRGFDSYNNQSFGSTIVKFDDKKAYFLKEEETITLDLEDYDFRDLFISEILSL